MTDLRSMSSMGSRRFGKFSEYRWRRLLICFFAEDIKTLIPRPNWISAISGTFKDDPEFDEVLRLGKEFREADQPKETD
jgi:hypothetical protein